MVIVNYINLTNLEIIQKNLQEYLEIADYSFSRKKYNTAVTLYYKVLVELCDFILLQKTKKVGANHTERFDMLKLHAPELYAIASKLFRYYRDSYSEEISEVVASTVKKEVEHAQKLVFS